MDKEEKIKQIQAADNTVDVNKLNDIDIIFPEPVKFSFGNRKTKEHRSYEIYPQTIEEQAHWQKIQTAKSFEEITEIVGKFLGEEDLEFVKISFDAADMTRLSTIINHQNTKDMASVLKKKLGISENLGI